MTHHTIGIIGAGVLGGYHAGKIIASPRATCGGVFDLDESRRMSLAEKQSIPSRASLSELFDNCDSVIVAVNALAHYDVVFAALMAGKHVLVEKPLAATHAQGAVMVEKAAQVGVVLQVGHSEAFNPAFLKLMEMKPDPRFIEIHRLAAFSLRGTDVSVIHDLMVHDLHLLYRLCGALPLEATLCATGVPVLSADIDIVNARLEFPQGCIANVTTSRISATRMRKLRIFQKNNYFSVDLDKKEFVQYELIPGGAPGPLGIPVNEHRETLEALDALTCEQDSFMDTIEGITPRYLPTTGTEALAILAMTEMILKKLATS